MSERTRNLAVSEITSNAVACFDAVADDHWHTAARTTSMFLRHAAQRRRTMRLASFAISILAVSTFTNAAPRQNSSSEQSASAGQQESIGDAARRAREQKKEEPKPTKVWTNDDIPKTGESISIIGPPSEAAPTESSEAPKTEKKPEAVAPEEKADLQAKLDEAKAHLASLKTDLDIVQRKYVLDEQTYLSNPNHDRDTAGAQALGEEKQQIADKQQQIADAQKKVDDLQAQLARAGASESK